MSDKAGNSLPPDAAPPNPDEARSFFVQNRLGAGLAIALLLVLAIVISSHWPAFTGTGLQSPRTSAETPKAPAQPQTVEARPQTESTPARTPVIGPANNTVTFTDLATRLGGVEARLNAVENTLARAADRDVQTALQSRVARLESESSGEALRRAGAVLALATLARAAGEARPFKPQLDAIVALAPDDPAITALSPYAAQGAPTVALLAARFPDAARGALDAERTANAGNGIFAKLWSSVTGLVRVRRIGDVTGGTSADKLARAESDLNRGDLASAILETQGLEGEAQAAMAAWLKDALARQSIDSAIGQMESRIVEALAAPSPAASPPPRQPPAGPAQRNAPPVQRP
jgi:hypothetical protein